MKDVNLGTYSGDFQRERAKMTSNPNLASRGASWSLWFACAFLALLLSVDAGAQCAADPGCAADPASAAYASVIANDPFCCNSGWDGICQNAYDLAGGLPNPDPACGGGACALNALTFEMYDSFGDGWNGSVFTIVDENTGLVVANGTLDAGSFGTVALCLPNGCYQLNVSAGSFAGEVSWVLPGTDAGTLSGGAPITVSFSLNDASCSGGGGPCADEAFTFSAGGGTFDGEISWSISGPNGFFESGVAVNGLPLCLPAGCYTVELFDSFGDGWDGAIWTLVNEAGTITDSGTMASGSYAFQVVSIGGADCGNTGGTLLQVSSGTMAPDVLITDVFLGDCLEASNIQFTGSASAIGTFSNGGGIGIEEGIILTSGSAVNAVGPNGSGSTSSINGTAGNPLLDNISGMFTYDAAVFTFDFVAQTDQVTFNYVFASEEYPEFVCSSFNDAFGFFVSGPGYAPNTNIAVVPGTTDFVTIDNVNNNGLACPPYYPAYYSDNVGGGFVEYDGYTTPLQATINTVPCATYQIVIAVADAGDSSFDSAVFLEAQSFTAGVDVNVAAASSLGQSSEGSCEESGYFLFVNNGDDFLEPVTLTFTVSGSALSGGIIDPLPTSITFQPGETSIMLEVEALAGSLGVTPESVTITMDPDQGCSCDTELLESTLFLCVQAMLPLEWLTFEAELSAVHDEVLCSWSTASESNTDRFTVERSSDALAWADIGELPAAGHSQEVRNYLFTDRQPLIGRAYYRIRQTDTNGSFSHSSIRSVERNEASHTAPIRLFPNPSSGRFQLSIEEPVRVRGFDMTGRVVQVEQLEQGDIFRIHAAAGQYVIEVGEEEGEVHRFRLIVD